MSKWVVFLSYINFGGDLFPCIDIAKVLNILEVQKSGSTIVSNFQLCIPIMVMQFQAF
jgi:hypothetical protein